MSFNNKLKLFQDATRCLDCWSIPESRVIIFFFCSYFVAPSEKNQFIPDSFFNDYKQKNDENEKIKRENEAQKAKNEEINNQLNATNKYIATIHNTQGTTFSRKGKFEQAVFSFSAAIKYNQENADLYAKRGDAEFFLRKYRDAITDYTMAINKNTNFADAYNMRGLSLILSGSFIQSIDDFNKAIELDQTNPRYYGGRGLANSLLVQENLMCFDYNKACELGDCYFIQKAKKENFCSDE